MAVTTEREYGLFINGELVEAQSGELRDLSEPAVWTGDPARGRRIASRIKAYLETKSVLVGTGGKPFNPFGL